MLNSFLNKNIHGNDMSHEAERAPVDLLTDWIDSEMNTFDVAFFNELSKLDALVKELESHRTPTP
jgi:hypothetical protein